LNTHAASNGNVPERLAEIVLAAQDLSAQTLTRMTDLLQAAETVAAETGSVRSELEQFLDQFSLESGIADGSSNQIRFAGGVIDLESMRADVASMALNAARATNLVTSLKSIQSSLNTAARHFSQDTALITTIDAREEGMQASLFAAREDERRKLAREIHDGPAQVLANAVYHVQIVEQVVKRNPGAVDEELMRLRELLKEGGTEVRRFMFDLRPTALQDYGLGPTLKRCVEDWGRFFGHRVSYSIENPLPRLSPDEDLVVFRIVQQSLQNIHQHAGNDCAVDLSVCVQDQNLIVRICDDGVGFDPALVSPKLTSGAGLLGMRERAATVHATLNIESNLGVGSTITLCLPISRPVESGNVLPRV